MSNIPIRNKINIFFIGFVSSLLFLLMFYALFAQILADFVIGNLETNSILFVIILGLLLISFLMSIMSGFMIIKDIKQASIIKSSIMSIILTFFILIVVSYVSLFILYPDVFRNLNPVEMIVVFPQVIIYFGIYVLNQIYVMFIFTLIIYFLLFVTFLEAFYKYAPKKYVKIKKSKW